MALISCIECRKEVSDTAKACPHCGAKVTRPLRMGRLLLIAIGAVTIIGAIGAINNPSNISGPSPAEVARQQRLTGLASVDLSRFNWKKGGFNSIMLADFTLTNKNNFAVNDIEITCTSYAPSGTAIDKNTRVLYEEIATGKSKRVRDFNMGFQHTQSQTVACQVTDIFTR